MILQVVVLVGHKMVGNSLGFPTLELVAPWNLDWLEKHLGDGGGMGGNFQENFKRNMFQISSRPKDLGNKLSSPNTRIKGQLGVPLTVCPWYL